MAAWGSIYVFLLISPAKKMRRVHCRRAPCTMMGKDRQYSRQGPEIAGKLASSLAPLGRQRMPL